MRYSKQKERDTVQVPAHMVGGAIQNWYVHIEHSFGFTEIGNTNISL